MAIKIQIRRDSASAWSANNPTLSSGEIGWDTTNKKGKIGDGATAWNSLAYSIFTEAELNGKAGLSSPAFTGTPTAPTASAGTNTTQIATTAFVRTEVSNLVASAPAALDTLDELAAALGDDPNFATTVTNSIAAKAPLASPALTGTPTAPTAAGATNTTQIATTEFVQTAVGTKANSVSPTFTGTAIFDGITVTGSARFQEMIEDIVDVAHASNVLTLDYNSGNVFYMATAFAASPAVTVNITNAPTTDGRVFTVTLFAVQGATGYNPSVLNINGSAATIRWAGGVTPTPTSSAGKIDIYSFTIIRRASAWTALASAVTNF